MGPHHRLAITTLLALGACTGGPEAIDDGPENRDEVQVPTAQCSAAIETSLPKDAGALFRSLKTSRPVGDATELDEVEQRAVLSALRVHGSAAPGVTIAEAFDLIKQTGAFTIGVVDLPGAFDGHYVSYFLSETKDGQILLTEEGAVFDDNLTPIASFRNEEGVIGCEPLPAPCSDAIASPFGTDPAALQIIDKRVVTASSKPSRADLDRIVAALELEPFMIPVSRDDVFAIPDEGSYTLGTLPSSGGAISVQWKLSDAEELGVLGAIFQAGTITPLAKIDAGRIMGCAAP